MNSSTIPQTTEPAPSTRDQSGVHLTPLATAALRNGVAFEDVHAYLTGIGCPQAEDIATSIWQEMLIATGEDRARDAEFATDVALEGALARSVAASGSIEHARLFWRGVL
jgi:hypothetical protein